MLKGPRSVVPRGAEGYPQAFEFISSPPACLYVIGDPAAMQEGLAVVGARKATPYGLSCAEHFAGMAAERGIAIISGGARGCDSASHRAALAHNASTVVFLGGGCDQVYPPENFDLFQDVIRSGGAVVSENEWGMKPYRALHRKRNRLIAGLAKATLIVEAGLPSGTFTTADDALAANKEVLVVPGAITSKQSRGANRLIYQGATPVIDDDTFNDQLDAIYGRSGREGSVCAVGGDGARDEAASPLDRALRDAVQSEQHTLEQLRGIAAPIVGDAEALSSVMRWLAEAQAAGIAVKYPNGRYGAVVRKA